MGMSAFLEGYTVRVAALVMPCLAISYAVSFSDLKRGVRLDLAILFFSAFIVIWSYAFGLTKNPTAALDYIGASLVWVSYYFNIRLVRIDEKWARYIHLPATLIVAFVVAFNVKAGMFTLGTESQVATYQGFALVLLVMTLLAMASFTNVLVIWGQWLASLVMLFLIGARSEFAALIIGGTIYIMLLRGSAIVKSILFANAFVMVFLNISEFEVYTQNRVVVLLESGAYANRVDRQYAFDYAIDAIRSNPLIGSFGAYPDGLFAHNAIAAWADFGFFGFLFFILLVGIPLVRILKSSFSLKRTTESVLAASALLSVVFLLITSKTFVYFLVPVALGISRLPYSKGGASFPTHKADQQQKSQKANNAVEFLNRRHG